MKQVLLYSLLLCGFLIGAVACSSDDAEIMGPALSDVNADYQNASMSKALEIYYGGNLLSGSNKTATFYSEDKQVAVITLRNVIPGIEALELRDVLLSSSKDQTQFLFGGTVQKTDYTIDYEGTVAKDKMTLTVSAKLVANDAVAGRWMLQKVQKEGDVYKKQSVTFAWTTTEEFPGFKIKTADGYNLTLSCSEVSRNLSEGFSEYMDATGLIKEITLRSDGNLIVVYAKQINGSETVWQESDMNALQYHIADGKLYLTVSEKILGANASDDVIVGIMKTLIKQYGNGVPFVIDATESGKLSLYLDKEVLSGNSLVSMMSVFKSFLPAQSNYVSISLLQNVFDNYSVAMKATTKIQLGLNFNQIKQNASY